MLVKSAIEERTLNIALAGNPNVGKTAIFNALTGSHQRVGNWPGVTVEKKEGFLLHSGTKLAIIDLPGIYGLNAYSMDERVSRDYLAYQRPDLTLSIVDSTNLERNLYLSLQLMEMGQNVLLTLNMQDELDAKGITIDAAGLSSFLGIPVVMVSALKRFGIDELKDRILEKCAGNGFPEGLSFEDSRIEKALGAIEKLLSENTEIEEMNYRWLAIKLLEKDPEYQLLLDNARPYLKAAVNEIIADIDRIFGDSAVAIAQARYSIIEEIMGRFVKQARKSDDLTDRVDRILTNKWLGIPIFFFFMWLTFQLTFVVGNFFLEMIDEGFGLLADTVTQGLSGNLPDLFVSFLADGVIGGVGGVMVFLPNIFFLFLAIGVLEASGYMSRAAFVMDRLMNAIGLHGKSFIPMILGFGCTVPAVMATRTLESRKDRLITMLVSPFMSCSARLPIYLTFTAVFFSKNQGTIIFSIYIIGIAVAILMSRLFKSTILKGESSPFVMELPPYRVPNPRELLRYSGQKAMVFLKRAGTIIFLVIILVWALAALPAGVEYASHESYAGMIGSALTPLIRPMGFDQWETGVALLMGGLAKEVVVGSFATLLGDGRLEAGLSEFFTPLSAYAFMIFTLLYMPCVAVFGTIWREAGAKWAFFTMAYTTGLAFVVSTAIFQIGRFFTG